MGQAGAKLKLALVVQIIRSKLENLVNKAASEVRLWSRLKTRSCKCVSVL